MSGSRRRSEASDATRWALTWWRAVAAFQLGVAAAVLHEACRPLRAPGVRKSGLRNLPNPLTLLGALGSMFWS